MKRVEETTSLWGMLAYLGIAAAIAYLGSENDRQGAKGAVASEKNVPPAQSLSAD